MRNVLRYLGVFFYMQTAIDGKTGRLSEDGTVPKEERIIRNFLI